MNRWRGGRRPKTEEFPERFFFLTNVGSLSKNICLSGSAANVKHRATAPYRAGWRMLRHCIFPFIRCVVISEKKIRNQNLSLLLPWVIARF
jgi:hypothetical protein